MEFDRDLIFCQFFSSGSSYTYSHVARRVFLLSCLYFGDLNNYKYESTYVLNKISGMCRVRSGGSVSSLQYVDTGAKNKWVFFSLIA